MASSKALLLLLILLAVAFGERMVTPNTGETRATFKVPDFADCGGNAALSELAEMGVKMASVVATVNKADPLGLSYWLGMKMFGSAGQADQTCIYDKLIELMSDMIDVRIQEYHDGVQKARLLGYKRIITDLGHLNARDPLEAPRYFRRLDSLRDDMWRERDIFKQVPRTALPIWIGFVTQYLAAATELASHYGSDSMSPVGPFIADALDFCVVSINAAVEHRRGQFSSYHWLGFEHRCELKRFCGRLRVRCGKGCPSVRSWQCGVKDNGKHDSTVATQGGRSQNCDQPARDRANVVGDQLRQQLQSMVPIDEWNRLAHGAVPEHTLLALRRPPECYNIPLQIQTVTSRQENAKCDGGCTILAQVRYRPWGQAQSTWHYVGELDNKHDNFEKGQRDYFGGYGMPCLHYVDGIALKNTGTDGWHVQHVDIVAGGTRTSYRCNFWIETDGPRIRHQWRECQ